MFKEGPQGWKTLYDFCTWMERNCENCRWRSEWLPGERSNGPCRVSEDAYSALLHSKEMPRSVVGTVCNPGSYGPGLDRMVIPWACHTRKDVRGRKPKSA